MGVSGVGDRVTGRRGELVGAQGVLSARWLVRTTAAKNGNEQSFPSFLYKIITGFAVRNLG